MKLYNTDIELTMSDYKPLPALLTKETLQSLYELSENLENAIENAYIYHSDLFALAIQQQQIKVDMYIRMKERKEGEKQ